MIIVQQKIIYSYNLRLKSFHKKRREERREENREKGKKIFWITT